MTTRKKSAARQAIERRAGGPLRLGMALAAIREGDELSQTDFAETLGISRSHLCDIEKGRKTVSPARAAQFARVLGYGEKQFVRLALQELVDQAGLELNVHVEAA
jgi:transcriptional regulator with XRE-family HTH domain